MHLTTLVSLLAVGAVARPAAAPVPRSLDLNTRMAKPTMALPSDPADLFKGLQDAKAPEVTGLARRQDETEEPVDSSSSSSSSAGGLIPELPTGILRARQEPAPTGEASFRDHVAAEDAKDPLEAYIESFNSDGENDEAASDAALDHYNASIDEENKKNEPSGTDSAPAGSTMMPEIIKSSDAVTPAVNKTASHMTKERPTDMDLEKLDATASNVTSPVKDAASSPAPAAPSSGLPEDLDVEKMAAKLNMTSTEAPAEKNETSSAAPEPTAEKASSDPLAKLQSMLPIKRADIPELPVVPAITKRQLAGVMSGLEKMRTDHIASNDATEKNGTAPATAATTESDVTSALPAVAKRQLAGFMNDLEKMRKDHISSNDVSEKNVTAPATTATEEKKVTTPAVPAVEEKNTTTSGPADVATPEAKNTTSSAVNETASTGSEDGYYGINKHMAKLDKLPLGGLPIKRQAPDFLTAPVAEPVAEPKVANAQPTGGLPSKPEVTEPKVAEPEVEISRPAREDRESRATYQISGANSPLHKHLVPLQNQHDKVEQAPADVAAAAPSVSAEEAPVELSQ